MRMSFTSLIARRPWASTILFTVVWLGIGITTALWLPLLFPTLDVTYVRALGTIALAVVAALVAAILGWRWIEPDAGSIRSARVYIVPIVIVSLPLFAGLRVENWRLLAFIVVMELLTGLSEELFFRNFILRMLLPRGVFIAVLVSSLLFGLVHLANILYGEAPLIAALHVLGAASFGAGMAAIVLRGGAFWPVVLIHALSNSALRFSWLTPSPIPVPAMSAIVSILLLVYAILLLRRSADQAHVPIATMVR